MWFRGLRLIDTLTGGVTAGGIEVVDGLVTEVGEAPSEGADDIDLRGAYVLPGLISCHTHLQATYPYEARDEHEVPHVTMARAAKRAAEALAAGITTVRCLHELHAVDVSVRAAIVQGEASGPRILAAGRALTTTGGHGDGLGCRVVDGRSGFFHGGLIELEGGADHLKVFATGGLARAGESLDEPQMSFEEMRGAVEAADQHGTYVVAHAAGSRAIQQGLAAGIRSFEHAYRLDDDTAVLMAGASAYLGATLVVTHSPAWMVAAGFGDAAMARSLAAAEEHLSSIGRAIRAGVTIVNSTDFPPGSLDDGVPLAIREMELGVQAGLEPLGVIQGATLHGAELMRLPALGRVQPGSPADLIAVDGNPLDDIRAMRRITTVIQAGRIVRQASLPSAH